MLNLLSGFAATVLASEGYIEYATFLIIAGMVFDFADGFTARLLKAYSALGKDLDSLADVVTFGVAPGAIVMTLLTGTGVSLVPAFAVAGVIPVASALRLAKFNNDTTQATYFRGMATPASAFTVISFVIASEYGSCDICETLLNSAWFLIILSLFLAVMMLVNMRMFSLKFTSLKIKGNEERYLFVAVSVLLVAVIGLAAAPLIMTTYILISLLSAILGRHKSSSAAD
jgi:CDP-diacylglycerol--serine O-phosphatidyltransferase